MLLAFRNLVQDTLRFFLSVIGIALGVMLILFLLGLRQGVFQSTMVYLEHTPGSIAVLPAGVTSSHGHGQIVPAATVARIAATPGVARAIPVVLQQAALELHGKKEIVQLVGYDADLGGGPWQLAAGREPSADNEIVVDRALAGRHRLHVGQSFDIKGHPLTVVGLSNQTATFTGAYVFGRVGLLETLTLAPGGASYVIVTPAPGTARNDLMAALRTLPGTSVVPKQTVMDKDRAILSQALDQVVFLMVAAAFVVGALVVGLVIYSATVERRSEYGILKAIGARSRMLYRVVAWQALIAASAGSLLGIGLAFAFGSLVTTLKPQFLVSIGLSTILITLAAGFIMAVAGALVPARAVTSLAPAEVFRR